MTTQLTQHMLTEKFFNLTMLFQLEMQRKDGAPLYYQGQGNVLMALGEQDHLSQKELTARLNIAAPSTTEFVNKLVKKGLVTKSRSEQDRRVTIISLTPAGRNSLVKVNQTDINDWTLLSPNQQAQLADLLDIMVNGLSQKYDDTASKQMLASLKRHFIQRATK